jgi:acyl-CoA hydrolase
MTGPMIRPYGDTTGDGRVQLSFTLPVPFGTEHERAVAEGAALQLAAKMGLEPAMVVHAKGMGPAFTFFIVYGRASHLVDLSEVTVAEREFPVLSAAEINLRIRSGLGREMVVLGACIGTDAHTVGIDAILNVKGHSGEKGLEYYREMRVVNLGGRARGRGAGQPGRHPARRAPGGRPYAGRCVQHGDGRRGSVRRGAPRPAAAGGRRPPVRPHDGGRARRGQGLQPRHHPPRGGQLPGARPHPRARRGRSRGMTAAAPREGLSVTHRRYVPASHAHYGGNLVDGAYVLGLFGDVATELAIRTDGDESLFASYSEVQFLAPVLAGDVIEATAVLTHVGRRSRELAFEARVVCRAEPERGPSASRVLDEPIIVVTATGTIVVPAGD